MSTGSRPPAEAASRRWRRSLAAGLAPAMLLGFTASALADRLVFVAWALLAAGLYGRALRRGFERSGGGFPTAPVLAAAAGAFLALALLVARYHGDLDLGFRAFLWPVYHPWITRPAAWAALGLGCLLAAGAASWRSRPATGRRAT